MNPITNVSDLFMQELLYMMRTEYRSLDAMNVLAGIVKDPQLREWIPKHINETNGQLNNLKNVCSLMNMSMPNTSEVPSTRGPVSIWVDAQEVLQLITDDSCRDYFGTCAQHKLETMECLLYESLITLGEKAAVPAETLDLLRQNLDQERGMADRLRRKMLSLLPA